jgi:4-hydroxybenzoate polyprenyltransferase
VLHSVAIALFVVFGYLANLAWPYYLGLAIVACVLVGVDLRVARTPEAVVWPFRVHMALGAVFLVGVAFAEYLPMGLR